MEQSLNQVQQDVLAIKKTVDDHEVYLKNMDPVLKKRIENLESRSSAVSENMLSVLEALNKSHRSVGSPAPAVPVIVGVGRAGRKLVEAKYMLPEKFASEKQWRS